LINITTQDFKNYFNARGLVWPEKSDQALKFLISEIGELADADVANEDEWIRNNPNSERRTDFEISDVMMMLFVYADLKGLDPHQCVYEKILSKGYDLIELREDL